MRPFSRLHGAAALACGCALAAALTAVADSKPRTIGVTVRDAAGAPIPGAMIELRGGAAIITTDALGSAQFELSGDKLVARVYAKEVGEATLERTVAEDVEVIDVTLKIEPPLADQPAPRSGLRRSGTADDGGIAGGIPVSCASGSYCQLPTQFSRQSGIGAGLVLAATSDRDPGFGFLVAENVQASAAGSVSTLCWWGIYRNFGAGVDCAPGVAPDAFEVVLYNDDAGGTVPGTVKAGPLPVTVTAKFPTGNSIIGIQAEYQFEGTIPPVAVAAGECYWIEISNNAAGTGCAWLWDTAEPGDGRGAQSAGGAYARTDYDLALCVNHASVTCPPPPGPANDDCVNAIALTVPSTTAGDTSAGNPSSAQNCSGVGAASPDIWYSVVGTGTTITASLCDGSTFYDSAIEVYCRDCDNLLCVVGNDDFCGLQTQLSWCSQSGLTYLIRVHGFGTAAGSFNLALTEDGVPCTPTFDCLAGPPANDDCADAQLVSGPFPVTVTGNTAAAAGDVPPAITCITAVTAPGVWYRVAGTGNTMTASTCLEANSGLHDMKLNVYCGTCNGLTCITGEDDDPACGFFSGSGFPQPEVFWCSQLGAEYLILVQGFGGQVGPFTLEIRDDGFACTGGVSCLPTGACCLPNDTCVVTTAPNCASLNGDYAGNAAPCTTSGGSPLTYTATPNLPIPDGPGGTTSTTMNIPDPRVIGDVNVTLRINHTWVGDLIVDLTHVNSGTTVRLIERAGLVGGEACSLCCGCSADNYNGIILDDEGTLPIESQCVTNLTSPPNYTPFASLSAFDGLNQASDWTLTACDGAGADIGTIVSWSITTELAGENTCPLCAGDRGDINCDGAINFFDIDPFLLGLFDLAAYQAQYCGGDICALDVNCDELVNFFDIDPFLACLFSTCPPCP